jgi:sialate O-acetylesterase
MVIEALRSPESLPLPPSSLYNAMIAPVAPYGLRGFAWYQGEGNAGRSEQYRDLLPAMIEGWRKAWSNPVAPFLIVQLANFGRRHEQPAESGWAELREAQLMTARRVPKTGLAVAIDIGDGADVHPTEKREVGRRLALWALATTYGQPAEYSGPLYRTFAIEGGSVRIRLDHAGALAARGGGPLKGFAVAGADRKFAWAEARIEADGVVVSSPSVPRPVAVRYGWDDDPECNLVNGANLPASPFRTDDWPGVTAGLR